MLLDFLGNGDERHTAAHDAIVAAIEKVLVSGTLTPDLGGTANTTEVGMAIARLDRDHHYTEVAVRDIQHLLLGWELMGESRKQVFLHEFTKYVSQYLEHMRLEESVILPEAERTLTEADWKELDAEFEKNCDPLTGKYKPDPVYEKLFSRIVRDAPAPIGLGGG